MLKLITDQSATVPKPLAKLITLGMTLKKRASPISPQPRLEQRPDRDAQRHTRTPPRSALGFRNLTDYIARSQLETGGFRPQPHRRLG